MENQEVNETPSVEFLSDEQVQNVTPEEIQQSEAATPPPPDVIDLDAAMESEQQEATAPVEETFDNTENQQQTQESPVDLDAEVLSYLSEKLGRDLGSFDDLATQQQESVLDERVEAIARFVQETGRDPQDWFRYQQLNASEMDDITAVKINMISDYQDLSSDDLDTLLSSKYKLDPNLHTEEEVKLSMLQLKMDAKEARDKINGLRESYKTPVAQQQSVDDTSPFDDQWVASMKKDLGALDGVEFDLGDGKSFTFGLTNDYKGQLAEKNTRLEEFFDPYVNEDGKWDYDMLNMHRTVIDNIETIVQSVYKQGMSDGQRGIVNQAANVSAKSPNQGSSQSGDSSLAAQLRQALGNDRLTFR
jgi:hypothetical protein